MVVIIIYVWLSWLYTYGCHNYICIGCHNIYVWLWWLYKYIWLWWYIHMVVMIYTHGCHDLHMVVMIIYIWLSWYIHMVDNHMLTTIGSSWLYKYGCHDIYIWLSWLYMYGCHDIYIYIWLSWFISWLWWWYLLSQGSWYLHMVVMIIYIWLSWFIHMVVMVIPVVARVVIQPHVLHWTSGCSDCNSWMSGERAPLDRIRFLLLSATNHINNYNRPAIYNTSDQRTPPFWGHLVLIIFFKIHYNAPPLKDTCLGCISVLKREVPQCIKSK